MLAPGYPESPGPSEPMPTLLLASDSIFESPNQLSIISMMISMEARTRPCRQLMNALQCAVFNLPRACRVRRFACDAALQAVRLSASMIKTVPSGNEFGDPSWDSIRGLQGSEDICTIENIRSTCINGMRRARACGSSSSKDSHEGLLPSNGIRQLRQGLPSGVRSQCALLTVTYR